MKNKTDLSYLIVSRIKRDGPMAHIDHLLSVLPTDHPVRQQHQNAFGYVSKIGEVIIRRSGAVETPASQVYRTAQKRVIEAIKQCRPDIAGKCGFN